MQLRNGQHGLGLWGWIFVLGVIGFVSMVTLQLVPIYLAELSIQKVVKQTANDPINANAPIQELRKNMRTRWDVEGAEGLDSGGWYLVNCNHQSWVDVFVLQHVLRGRIPLLKFFLKQQLIYVPVIGLAWWALDFPFMRRHGKEALRRKPELRAQDHEATLRACRKFLRVPTSVMNFAEGTRFTAVKHDAQGSPYRHLLKPKAGALALTLNAMGERFRSLVDATIVYPDGVPSFWDFMCGRVPRVAVRVRQLAIPDGFAASDYATDPAFRRQFTRWLTALWQEKDREFEELLQRS